MTDDRPLPKTYAWNLNKHPRCCVECGKEFKRGDRVYPICAVAIHAGCRLPAGLHPDLQVPGD